MPPKGKNLTDEARAEILAFLWANVDASNFKNCLKRGTISAASVKFNCGVKSVQRLWDRSFRSIVTGQEIDVRSKKATRVYAKKINRDQLREAIRALPISERRSIRCIAAATGVSVGTVANLLKEEEVGLEHVGAKVNPHFMLNSETSSNELQYYDVG